MKEKEVFDAYQKSGEVVGELASQLSWMMVLILCAALIGKKLIISFVVSGGFALVYFLLSILHALWHTIGFWIVKQRMNPGEDIDDYPKWIRRGAWTFLVLEVIVMVIAVAYFVKDMIYLVIE